MCLFLCSTLSIRLLTSCGTTLENSCVSTPRPRVRPSLWKSASAKEKAPVSLLIRSGSLQRWGHTGVMWTYQVVSPPIFGSRRRAMLWQTFWGRWQSTLPWKQKTWKGLVPCVLFDYGCILLKGDPFAWEDEGFRREFLSNLSIDPRYWFETFRKMFCEHPGRDGQLVLTGKVL